MLPIQFIDIDMNLYHVTDTGNFTMFLKESFPGIPLTLYSLHGRDII